MLKKKSIKRNLLNKFELKLNKSLKKEQSLTFFFVILIDKYCFFFFFHVSVSNGIQMFEETPQYTEINPGEDAKLICRVLGKRGLCIWQKDQKVC